MADMTSNYESEKGESAMEALTFSDGKKLPYGTLTSCCAQTMYKHASHNPMMVCDECNQIIKCFKEEKELRNYVMFCRTRRRPVMIFRSDKFFIATFYS